MITGSTETAYRDLLLRFLPRPIMSTAEYETTQQEVDWLVDKGELTAAEADYLHLLGTLIAEYEARTEEKADYKLHGVALVRGLMELHNLKQKDLVSIFKTKSITSAVLNGKRPLTVEHINQLAHRFNLPHNLFFEPLN